jgi:hypothetical protein
MNEQSAKDFATSKHDQRRAESRSSNQSSDGLSGPPIAIGTRFKMSALGAARRVLFDGSKSPISLHRDYVEQLIAEPE